MDVINCGKRIKNPEIFVDSWRKTENAAELLDEKTILLEDEDDRTVLLLEEPIGRLVSKNPEQEEIVLMMMDLSLEVPHKEQIIN